MIHSYHPFCPLLCLISAHAPSMSFKSRDCEQTRPQPLGGPSFVRWSSPRQLDLAMECIQMRSISTLLKRISLIERVIDIDDCLTMIILCQFASMHIPFFSRSLSVWCYDNVFFVLCLCVSLYSPYSSFRTFFSFA